MIVIIDYGMGNVGSIRNMLKKAGAQSIVSSDADAISRADAIILQASVPSIPACGVWRNWT